MRSQHRAIRDLCREYAARVDGLCIDGATDDAQGTLLEQAAEELLAAMDAAIATEAFRRLLAVRLREADTASTDDDDTTEGPLAFEV